MIEQENVPYTADEIKAMVKTIEELRKKYNDALDRAKILIDKLEDNHIKGFIYHIFPELLESEDERIKNEIIAFVEQSIHRGGGTPIPQEQENKWIAWLEKQGEKSTIIDVDKMVFEYSTTEDGDLGFPINCMIRAYRKGINDALKLSKERFTWKPSKEQIAALRWVLNNVPYTKHKEEINGLLDQIKDL